MKKLYRSKTDKFFAGIFGGLGEYFNIDPAILRIVWVMFLIFTGVLPGIIAYIIFLFIVPPKPKDLETK